ncbi:MAG TPA: S41 family peptidase [Pyrinomonadaceae bacterium]|nr:S41 family peptidase [Pyrinomonadaceae bacterium]
MKQEVGLNESQGRLGGRFRTGLLSKLLMSAAIVLAASSCRTNRAPPPALKTHAAPTNNLTPSDRSEIFEIVWGTINESYYDPTFRGVDWKAVRERFRPRMEAAPNDQEFYALFELMLAELRDDHTSFHGPPPVAEIADKDASRSKQGRTLGLALGEVEGQTVVTEVEADGGAWRAGVRPGMILRTVNGRAVEDIYREIRAVFPGASSERSMKNRLLRALLYGQFMPLPRTLGFVNLDGTQFTVQPELTPAPPTPHVAARRLASGFGYIKFDSWAPPADRRFNEELAGMFDAPGLIIDLRANGGGHTEVLLNVASNFFAAPTYTGGFRRRDGTLDRYLTHIPKRLYRQPVVILIDERSASASETFTTFMQESGRAYVIGRQSSGSTLNTRIQRVKGGGELRVSRRAYISPGGRNPEGTGVVPDQVTPLTISDLRQGRDVALEAAEAYLKFGTGKK